jgi:PTS system nitrogen regulatory IIA component
MLRNKVALDKWLTPDELAAYLKLSRSAVYKLAQAGQLPASKIGKNWRFDREAVDEWMRAQNSCKKDGA